MTQSKPLPTPTPETQPYWDSCKSHAMKLPRCKSCSQFHFYPRALCPHCWSMDLEWGTASGKGKIFSYVISHRPAPGFQDDVPYIIGVVELDEGVRLMTNIVGVIPEPKNIWVGMDVSVEYEDVSETITLPSYKPI